MWGETKLEIGRPEATKVCNDGRKSPRELSLFTNSNNFQTASSMLADELAEKDPFLLQVLQHLLHFSNPRPPHIGVAQPPRMHLKVCDCYLTDQTTH